MTGYTAPSTGQRVRAVLFDTFGTVVDWRSGISAAVRAFAAGRALTWIPDNSPTRGGRTTSRPVRLVDAHASKSPGQPGRIF